MRSCNSRFLSLYACATLPDIFFPISHHNQLFLENSRRSRWLAPTTQSAYPGKINTGIINKKKNTSKTFMSGVQFHFCNASNVNTILVCQVNAAITVKIKTSVCDQSIRTKIRTDNEPTLNHNILTRCT